MKRKSRKGNRVYRENKEGAEENWSSIQKSIRGDEVTIEQRKKESRRVEESDTEYKIVSTNMINL